MKLNQVLISNFRNISSASYDLAKVNVFTGPNRQGKTNTIEAVYWALSDYLIDGSKGFESMKPHNKSNEVVSVELIFDEFKLKKTYYEVWSPDRGSEISVLKGHETVYYVDDIKYKKISDAKRDLIEKLGLSEVKTSSNIDVIRSIIDPYYLSIAADWQDFRSFIIELVGDVDDLSILNSSDNYTIIKEDLIKYKFNFKNLTTFYKQQIKVNSDEIEKNKNIIVGYKAITDVESDELKQALKSIEDIENEIAVLRTQGHSTVNPNIAKLEKAHVETQQEYIESANADRLELQQMNAGINEKIVAKEQLLSALRKQYTELLNSNNAAKKNAMELDSKKLILESKIKEKTERQAALRSQWMELNDSEYVSTIVPRACKHCGGVLNDDELDAHKNAWETNKANQLDQIVKAGQSIKLELENLNFELQQLNSIIKVDIKLLEAQEEKVEKEIQHLSDDIELLRKSLRLEYVSPKTQELIVKGKGIKANLDNERLVRVENITDTLIAQKQSEKNAHNEIIAKHNAYLTIQKEIERVNELIETAQETQVSSESKLMMLEEFIKTKLSLLKNNVSSVFGDLEFVLVETNIKEGSYSEVCYPLILGKQTPFERGSGSEKIITGTHIIECVKKAKQLKDLPIIFDEIDKLDTHTIATELRTNSQIISTKVDDINYKKVTLVAQ